jgi:hypothetical protein
MLDKPLTFPTPPGCSFLFFYSQSASKKKKKKKKIKTRGSQKYKIFIVAFQSFFTRGKNIKCKIIIANMHCYGADK